MAVTAQQSHTLGGGASTCIFGARGPWGLDLDLAGLGRARPKSSRVDKGHSTPRTALQAGPHPRRRLRLPAWSTMSCSTSSIVHEAAKMEGARQQD